LTLLKRAALDLDGPSLGRLADLDQLDGGAGFDGANVADEGCQFLGLF